MKIVLVLYLCGNYIPIKSMLNNPSALYDATEHQVSYAREL